MKQLAIIFVVDIAVTTALCALFVHLTNAPEKVRESAGGPDRGWVD